METIARVEAIPFSIPYLEPKGTAVGVVASADHLVIRVTDSDGAVGCAEAVPRPMIHGETVGTVLTVYETIIGRLAQGRSIWDREHLHHDVRRAIVGHPAAKASFDMALHDLAARRLGTTSHRLLGGFSESVAITGHLTYGEDDQLLARAVELNSLYGITSFKVKIGITVERDARFLIRLREAFPTAIIYADANHAYDVFDTLRLAERISDLDLAWFEEPTPADEVLARQRLAAAPGIHILADESTTTPATVVEEVLAGRAHLVSIKVPRTGYLDSERIRIFSELTGTGLVIGTQGETGLGMLGSLAFAAAHQSTSRYPTELSSILELKDDLVVDPIEIKDGRLFVPDGPGSGATLDEDKLRHYERRAR